MKMSTRNLVIRSIASALAVVLLVGAGSLVFAKAKDKAERVISIKVKRFEYSPKEITLKKGVPVVLELKSLDVPHGFNLPDLGVRADVLPGLTARVRKPSEIITVPLPRPSILASPTHS